MLLGIGEKQVKPNLSVVRCGLLALAGSFVLLSGCGGGGGGGSTVSEPSVGYFIDAAVEGLSYSTPTQTGKTGADGSFKFSEGENVTFSLYGQPLFSPRAFTYLTPFDISDTSVDLGYSINLIRFLIALDVDGDPANGITLPAYSGAFDIDFNKSIRDFESDSDQKITNFLNANANGRALASVQVAVEHFNNSLSDINPTYTLALNGKTATSVIKNTKCTNGVTTGWKITFEATGLKLLGSDGFFNNGDGNCVANPEEDLNLPYSSMATGDFLGCAPSCSYKQLNRVTFDPNDTDGRVAVEFSWHTPNTNKIYHVKTILADPVNNNHPASLITFVQVVTLD